MKISYDHSKTKILRKFIREAQSRRNEQSLNSILNKWNNGESEDDEFQRLEKVK